MKLAQLLLSESKVDALPYNSSRDEKHENDNFNQALYHSRHHLKAFKAGDYVKAEWHKKMHTLHAGLDNGYANSPYKNENET